MWQKIKEEKCELILFPLAALEQITSKLGCLVSLEGATIGYIRQAATVAGAGTKNSCSQLLNDLKQEEETNKEKSL